MVGAGLDIDMRIDASLRDQFQIGKPRNQIPPDGGALAEQHDGVERRQPCGKTVDIPWLLAQGYRVAGAELSEIALRDLFAEMGVVPEVTETGAHRRYSASGVEIFAGDIFELTAETLGPVDAVYDRAALVALPEGMRELYAAHLAAITGRAPQLLVTFDYDQSVMDGPPFAVDEAGLRRCHDARFEIERLAEAEVPGGLKGVCPAIESAFLLRPSAETARS